MIKIKFKQLQEAEGDSEELVKINADKIRAAKKDELDAIKAGPDKSKIRDFQMAVKAAAEQGEEPSIFPKKVIDYFEKMPEASLPKEGLKAFVKWLANDIIRTEQFPDEVKVKTVADWFSFTESNDEIPEDEKFSYDINFEDAYAEALNFKAANRKRDFQYRIPPMRTFSNGWSIVHIYNRLDPEDIKHDLNRESCDKFMNHCVGDLHVKPVLAGEEDIYSLRDPKNEPHVTLSYNNKEKKFEECKGRSNSKPKDEYLEMILKWIELSGFEESEYEDLEHLSGYILEKEIQDNDELTDKAFDYIKRKQNDLFRWGRMDDKFQEIVDFFNFIAKHKEKIYNYDNNPTDENIIDFNTIFDNIGSSAKEELIDYVLKNWDKFESTWSLESDYKYTIHDFYKKIAFRNNQLGDRIKEKISKMLEADPDKISFYADLVLARNSDFRKFTSLTEDYIFSKISNLEKGEQLPEAIFEGMRTMFMNLSYEKFKDKKQLIYDIEDKLHGTKQGQEFISVLMKALEFESDLNLLKKFIAYNNVSINSKLLNNSIIQKNRDIYLDLAKKYIDTPGNIYLHRIYEFIDFGPPKPDLAKLIKQILKERTDFDFEKIYKHISDANPGTKFINIIAFLIESAETKEEAEYFIEKLKTVNKDYLKGDTYSKLNSVIDNYTEKYTTPPEFEVGETVKFARPKDYRVTDATTAVVQNKEVRNGKTYYDVKYNNGEKEITMSMPAIALKKIESVNEGKLFVYDRDKKVFKVLK